MKNANIFLIIVPVAILLICLCGLSCSKKENLQLTVDDIKSKYPMNTYFAPSHFPLKQFVPEKLPRKFRKWYDWKDNYLLPVRNQGKCGSCWAFAATGILGDHHKIHTYVDKQMSVQYLLSCDSKQSGCQGANNLSQVLTDLTSNSDTGGTPISEDVPYVSSSGTSIPCKWNKTQFRMHYFQPGTVANLCEGPQTGEDATKSILNRNIQRMKQEITRGPVIAAMNVYADFPTFFKKGTVYSWDGTSKQVGGHAIEIVGWDYDSKGEFWIIKNSWGPSWNGDGYFFIRIGDKGSGLEANAHSAQLLTKGENPSGRFHDPDALHSNDRPDDSNNNSNETMYYVLSIVVILLIVLGTLYFRKKL